MSQGQELWCEDFFPQSVPFTPERAGTLVLRVPLVRQLQVHRPIVCLWSHLVQIEINPAHHSG
jgi:hypothetical protein